MAIPGFVRSSLVPLSGGSGGLAPVGPAAAAPLGGSAPAASGAKGLGFVMHLQEQDNWCWAAVAVSVAVYYASRAGGVSAYPSQCVLATLELAPLHCCPAGATAACDKPWYLNQVLARVGHFVNFSAGAGSYHGHFAVVSGYSFGPTGEFLTIDDPIFARTVIPVADFPSAYQSGGAWTHSYWTTP
jgi:hypothetical protein